MLCIRTIHCLDIHVVFHTDPYWSIINCFRAQHTGFLGEDLEVLAGRPISCRVVAPNFNKVVGVRLHTLQPGVVLPARYHHPLGPSFTVFMIPPVLYLGHTGTGQDTKLLGVQTLFS